MTTERITLTADPVQITDGTNSAHITKGIGIAVYADGESSDAWHVMKDELNVSAPLELWVKDENNAGTEITVTTFTS